MFRSVERKESNKECNSKTIGIFKVEILRSSGVQWLKIKMRFVTLIFFVGVVSMCMANPGKQHLEGYIMSYEVMKGANELRIMCETQTDAINVVGFVDSDYVSDLDRRDLQWILFSHVVMEQLVRDL